MDISKWDILMGRVNKLRADADEILRQMAWMTATNLTPNGESIPCSGCGEPLTTEADFARHFLVNDARWLNFGRCPRPVFVFHIDTANHGTHRIEVPGPDGDWRKAESAMLHRTFELGWEVQVPWRITRLDGSRVGNPTASSP